MAAIHELTRDSVSVQRAVDFEDLVAAAQILVRIHEADGIGIGLRWQWRVLPVLYAKKRTCTVCHGVWPCWRARWAASTLSTLDGFWRELTGEDLAAEYGYRLTDDQTNRLQAAAIPHDGDVGTPDLRRRAG
jgi:hypothetical protein